MEKPKRKRRPKYTLDEMKKIFRDRGCKLLSKEYLGSKHPLEYRCICGKILTRIYNNWYRDRGCMCIQTKADTLDKLEREKLFDICEVAEIFGFRHHDVCDYVKAGVLPKPTRELNRRTKYYYNELDINEIAIILKGIADG